MTPENREELKRGVRDRLKSYPEMSRGVVEFLHEDMGEPALIYLRGAYTMAHSLKDWPARTSIREVYDYLKWEVR